MSGTADFIHTSVMSILLCHIVTLNLIQGLWKIKEISFAEPFRVPNQVRNDITTF